MHNKTQRHLWHYLFKKQTKLTPKTNYTRRKLRVSVFQGYGSGGCGQSLLNKISVRAKCWGGDYMEFYSSHNIQPFLQLENPEPTPANFSMWMENSQNYHLMWQVVLVFLFLVTRCDFSYLAMNCNYIRYTNTYLHTVGTC